MGLLVGLAWRRWREEPAPVIGLAATLAAGLAMAVARPLPVGVLAGLGLLALAGTFSPWSRRFPILLVLSALPGAWFIANSDLPGRTWVAVLVVAMVAIAGPLVDAFDVKSDEPSVPAVLLAISVAGVWLTVPDTEEALALLGAMTIPTILAWPLRLARLGSIGVFALVGFYMWVVAWGGRGREGAIVGATAAFGMLIAAPIGARIAGKKRITTIGSTGLLLLLVHLVLVSVVTRVAGLRNPPLVALALASPPLIAASLLWVAVEGLSPHSVVNSGPSGREITPEDV